MPTPTFAVKYPGRIAVILPGDCERTDISIENRANPDPDNPNPVYYVACKKKEPKDCRMVISSPNPIVENQRLPADAKTICLDDTNCNNTGLKCDRHRFQQGGDTYITCGCISLKKIQEQKQVIEKIENSE